MSRVRMAAAAWAVLALCSCSVVPVQPYRETTIWPLTVTPVAARTPDARAPVLLLRNLAAAPGLEGRGLITLRPDGSQFLDLYQDWAVPPAQGATEALRRRLMDSGAYAAVLAPGSRARAELTLEGTLTAFFAEPGRARASLELTLVNANGSVVLQTVETAVAPLASEAPAAKVTALRSALSEVLTEATARIEGQR